MTGEPQIHGPPLGEDKMEEPAFSSLQRKHEVVNGKRCDHHWWERKLVQQYGKQYGDSSKL
jgi:hypothetical protein